MRGCGGDLVAVQPRPPVIEGNWEIQAIEGRPVRGPRDATIPFRATGSAVQSAATSFGGSYRFERGYLIAGPLISTKMACPARR